MAHGSCLFVENAAGQTPLDLTVANQHHVIALFLESKMVFVSTNGGGGGRGTFGV